ncbi:MAG: glycosyltransferase family 4 protein [Planctomycetota bacterium]
MRIVFDLTSCAKPERGGISGYGRMLVPACARALPAHDYVPAVRANRWLKRGLVADLLPGRRVRLLTNRAPGLLLGEIDVLHAIGAHLPAGGRFAKVTTLPDLNVFEFSELSEPGWRARRQARIRQTLARADLVLAFSEQGAAALVQHLNWPRERTRVVPLGVDTALFRPLRGAALAAALASLGLGDRPYVLSAGRLSTRKNQAGLVAAFARAARAAAGSPPGTLPALPKDWLLVLPGPEGQDQELLREAARRHGLSSERLLLPGRVDDATLVALLSGAALYCCASLHEGFGLPVIEAQACGAPVLCSDRGALRETAGDCAVIFDPGDEKGFAAALAELAADPARRAQLAAEGPERVLRHFTWEATAVRTLAALAEAVELH